MKLADLIDKLVEIHNAHDHNPDVSIMTEHEVYRGAAGMEEVQFSADVTNVTFSKRNGVIIIGQELD